MKKFSSQVRFFLKALSVTLTPILFSCAHMPKGNSPVVVENQIHDGISGFILEEKNFSGENAFGVIAEMTDPAGACQITAVNCPNHSAKQGSFFDTQYGAGRDLETCAVRAHDYLVWCGSHVMRAAFFRDHHLDGVRTVGSYCQISQLSCPKHPQFVGNFFDSEEALLSEACMKRADEYHEWCGNSYSEATYFSLSLPVETKISGTLCRIRQRECPKRLEFAGVFVVNPKDPVKKESCWEQGQLYFDACGSDHTVAEFVRDGEVVDRIEINSQSQKSIP